MEKFLDDFQPDTYYHVYNHAIGHDDLFRQTENYRYFLEKYAEYLHLVLLPLNNRIYFTLCMASLHMSIEMA